MSITVRMNFTTKARKYVCAKATVYLQFGRGSSMLPGRIFDHALRHKPIFPCKLFSVRLSASRSEMVVGNWMNQGQETSNSKHANSEGRKAGELKQQGEHLCRWVGMVRKKQNIATKLQIAKKGNLKPKVNTLLRNTEQQTAGSC